MVDADDCGKTKTLKTLLSWYIIQCLAYRYVEAVIFELPLLDGALSSFSEAACQVG